jgi:S-adenosylmethionine:tRNA ribosyltransferase-isomerase
MKTADFDYDLPRAMIAQRPAAPRDSARLLEIAPDRINDLTMRDLPSLLRAGDLLVFNDTRVIATRLFGKRGAVRVEVTLHRRLGQGLWRAFARPGRRLRLGDDIVFDGAFHATVVEKLDSGEVTLAFFMNDEQLHEALDRVGAMPLPPYIKRTDADPDDRESYQTIFAREKGAIAAPTAGLHFTPELLAVLDARGVKRQALTLHVGTGTFLSVTAADPRDHRMHAELGSLSPEAAAAINATRAAGGRIVAVGTTSLRLLETASDDVGKVEEFHGDTDLFITPGYRFRVVDLLITNFHLPRSTLLMLACAFSGTDRVKAAYEHAKRAGYRFYSYGDACLLHRAP